MKRVLTGLACLLAVASALAAEAAYVTVPGGSFLSAVRYEDAATAMVVPPFQLMGRPVSNADFARFLQAHPQWRRDRLPAVFSSPGYLAHWQSAESVGDAGQDAAAVTRVTWYAADAYCRSQQARLPTFLEWEFAAAADEHRRDARIDARHRLRLLEDATPRALDAQADAPANAYGVYGLHGAHWEWADDFASLLSAEDRRGGEDGDALKFCGATSLAFNDRDQYAVVKRFAVLSALKPGDTLANLGFRCARSLP
jgi:formylglycine-generating enzyme required for sulfatase activity